MHLERQKVQTLLIQKHLKIFPEKPLLVDAIFGIGGRIDLGSKLEKFYLTAIEFESKSSHRCSNWT